MKMQSPSLMSTRSLSTFFQNGYYFMSGSKKLIGEELIALMELDSPVNIFLLSCS